MKMHNAVRLTTKIIFPTKLFFFFGSEYSMPIDINEKDHSMIRENSIHVPVADRERSNKLFSFLISQMG